MIHLKMLTVGCIHTFWRMLHIGNNMCSVTSSLMLLSGLKRGLNRQRERARERERVPQGALTTLRTVVCVDGVPLSFQ